MWKCRIKSATGVQQSARGLTCMSVCMHVKMVQHRIEETRIRHTRNATQAKNKKKMANRCEHVKML